MHLLYANEPAPAPDAEADGAAPLDPLPLNLAAAEKVLMRRALEQTDNNIAAAARLLGTNRPRVYRFLREEGAS